MLPDGFRRTLSLINLVVALPAEAKPLASELDLKRRQPDLGFPLYRSGRIALVVTGPGKANAAAGTAFLGALGNCRQEAIWVNFGIAGQAERRIGEVVLARSILDERSGRVWRPILPDEPPCSVDGLVTLERADTDYARAEVVDMEASGFFPTACRYSRAELVQVLKVISDNRRHSTHGLGAKQVRLLISEALATLEALLAGLEARVERRRETRDGRRSG